MSMLPAHSISGCDKGLPSGLPPMSARDVGRQNWNLLREDLPLPVAVLKEAALHHNSDWMRRFAERTPGVRLAPHGKTTMAPDLFQLQVQDGAWGITVATPHQLQVALASGHKRILIANQVIGRAAIGYLIAASDADETLEIYCLVDSLAGVARIEAEAARRDAQRPLRVLVEKGFVGGRSGARSVSEALQIARTVSASPYLALAGVEGFEGLIRGHSAEETLQKIEDFLREVVQIAEACELEGLFSGPTVLLSAGGSAFFDLVVKVFREARLSSEVQVLLRSGCYITHDSGLYTYAFTFLRQRAPELFERGGLIPALEVWAYVQSTPEPGLALVTLGKRDVSYDTMPIPEQWFRPDGSMSAPASIGPGHALTKLDDQHGYLQLPPDSPLAVGDMLAFGISHPCLTFDKWRVLHVVDAEYNVVRAVQTFF